MFPEIHIEDQGREFTGIDGGDQSDHDAGERIEDGKSLRTDSTVVETDIHYPTNNALIWIA